MQRIGARISLKIHVFPIMCMRGDPKIPGIVKKILFKTVVQVLNFSPLQSIPSCDWIQ
jgi:hypothetical protein